MPIARGGRYGRLFLLIRSAATAYSPPFLNRLSPSRPASTPLSGIAFAAGIFHGSTFPCCSSCCCCCSRAARPTERKLGTAPLLIIFINQAASMAHLKSFKESGPKSSRAQSGILPQFLLFSASIYVCRSSSFRQTRRWMQPHQNRESKICNSFKNFSQPVQQPSK